MRVGLTVLFLSCLARAQDGFQNQAPPPPQDQPLYQPQPGRQFRMAPAQDLHSEERWQRYLREHEEQQRREQEREDRLNAQAMRQLMARPSLDVPEPAPRPPQPPRPYHQPVMRDFADEIGDAVDAYVRAHSQKGVFVIEDPATGKRYRLDYAGIEFSRTWKTGQASAVGPARLETLDEPKSEVAVDFILEKGDAGWEVQKFLIRGIAGKAPAAAATTAPPAIARRAAVPKPKAPAYLSAEVSFKEPAGDGFLHGGETGTLTVKVSNAGPGPGYAVRLLLERQEAPAGLSLPSAVELGDIAAGKSASGEAALAASQALPDGKAKILLTVTEGNGFDTQPVLVELETRAFRPARLEIEGLKVAGGTINPGEAAKLAVTVRNAGQGAAQGAAATLELGGKDLFMSGEPTAALGTLEPGASKTVSFEFFVNRRLKAGQPLPISLALKESGRASSRPLGLVLGQSAAMTVLALKGTAAGEAAARREDVDAPPKTATGIDPDAYAVVVGIEKYRDVTGADYAARDAQVMRSYLTQSMGFDEKNVVLLENERATLTDLTTYLGPWLKDRATKKSRVFVYFSGHGAPNPATGQAYLVPYDGDPAYPETKAFAVSRLYDVLAGLPTDDILVVLDSCFSGAGGRSLLAQGTRPLVNVRVDAAPPNAVVLAASGPDQISTDDPDSRHGLLTYFLLKGLGGAADARKDGKITTKELYEYLKPAVERQARERHVEQTPALSPLPESLGKKGDRVWLRSR